MMAPIDDGASSPRKATQKTVPPDDCPAVGCGEFRVTARTIELRVVAEAVNKIGSSVGAVEGLSVGAEEG